jgi:hypothetical protein
VLVKNFNHILNFNVVTEKTNLVIFCMVHWSVNKSDRAVLCLSPYFLGLGITLCSKDLLDVYCSCIVFYLLTYLLATYSMEQNLS